MTRLKCPRGNQLNKVLFWGRLLGSLMFQVSITLFAQTNSPRASADLTLEVYLKRVVERNESIQTKLLEVEFNRRRLSAEYGAFEPAFFADVSHVSTERENTVEQANNQNTSIFKERNNIYEGGVETLVPSGARLRLGYTLRELNNNLPTGRFSTTPNTNTEYQTFFGLSLAQPLLKGAWRPANLAAIRVAALSSDLAYQDYRRQMMVMISTAIAAYWELYLAQEQLRFFQDSVATADKILRDNRARSEAGRGSELEVMEAQAGLALRRSKLGEAQQKLYESANKVLSLYSATVLEPNRLVRAVDVPQVGEDQFNYLDAMKRARDINPDYLSQQLKAAQEVVRLAYAKNQRMPELSLKASYGLNGLGATPGESWDDIQNQGFPSWSVGAEFRMPLAGDIKARNELRAAYLRCQEAKIGLREVETLIANAIDTALQKVSSARNSVQNYHTVVDFYQNLLDSSLAQLEVGRIESRKILDIEASLLDSRNSAAIARVQYQRAVLELELIQGSILKKHNFDLNQGELQMLTAELARHGELTDAEYADFLQKVQRAYEVKARGEHVSDTPAQRAARRALEATTGGWPATNTVPFRLDPETSDPVRRELRRKIDELQNPPPGPVDPARDAARDALRKKLEEMLRDDLEP
jgi:outer membrane protein TolC